MGKIKGDDEKFELSSGNVFKDLDLPNPETKLLKAQLAFHLCKIINNQNLTQKQIAKILYLDQPKISHILRGNLRAFSVERLLKFIFLLGYEFEIKIFQKK